MLAIEIELLTGRLPYEAASLGALLREVSQRPAPRLHGLRPDVPPELSLLVARLLEKLPEHRLTDARSLADDLDAILAALPERAPLDGPE